MASALERVPTFSHPDVTPKHSAKKPVETGSPLERLSQGDLSSWHTRTLANDPRLMPPPRKAVVRNSILMGRPAAVNAATSSMMRAHSVHHTLQRVPCPPTPPDSPADDTPPRRRNTLSWHPLPVFVGMDDRKKLDPATISAPPPPLLPGFAAILPFCV
ncbi:hypothetical protein BJV82DRAFT_668308 [Fennellomyces sp. T-0311]|nr:hypothetical protein BJV82DRAFT_668308 [Fennellomyces sp. T-0311]